jgi:hypothetical protein
LGVFAEETEDLTATAGVEIEVVDVRDASKFLVCGLGVPMEVVEGILEEGFGGWMGR